MATLIVHHKVQNYSAWRKVFDDHDKARREFGSTGYQVFQSASDPNDITASQIGRILMRRRPLPHPNDLKDAMKNAGVISQPEVMFLVEA